jgi:hypothetical protein
MEMEQKVKIVVILLVLVLLINSFILFGQAADLKKGNELNSNKKIEDKQELKDYTSKGVFKQRQEFIGYSNDYTVYVKNFGKGNYFDVVVYLKTAEGIEEKRFHRYIFSGDEEKFFFRELVKEKNYYLDWRYELI